MEIIQNAEYIITEWDGTEVSVTVQSSKKARVTMRQLGGRPLRCEGGDVFITYHDGTRHRVTHEYFKSLNPRPIH